MPDIVKVLDEALSKNYDIVGPGATIRLNHEQAKQTILQAIDTLVDEVIGPNHLTTGSASAFRGKNHLEIQIENDLRNKQRQRKAALLKGDKA